MKTKPKRNFDRFCVVLLLMWVAGGFLPPGVLDHVVTPAAGFLFLANFFLMILFLVILFARWTNRRSALMMVVWIISSLLLSTIYQFALFAIWDTAVFAVVDIIHLILLPLTIVAILAVLYLYFTSSEYLRWSLPNRVILWLIERSLDLDPSAARYAALRSRLKARRVSPRFEMVLIRRMQQLEQLIEEQLNRLEVGRLTGQAVGGIVERSSALFHRASQYQSAIGRHYQPCVGPDILSHRLEDQNHAREAALEVAICFLHFEIDRLRSNRLGQDHPASMPKREEPALDHASILLGYLQQVFSSEDITSTRSTPAEPISFSRLIDGLHTISVRAQKPFDFLAEALDIADCLRRAEELLTEQDYQAAIQWMENYLEKASVPAHPVNQVLFNQLRQRCGHAWIWLARQFTEAAFTAWAYQQALSCYWQAGDRQSLREIQYETLARNP
jgi:hypothetical protein